MTMFHNTNLSFLFIIVLLSFQSCNSTTPLERVLELSDSNRGELEAVLEHYSQKGEDSLKLRSAVFLIENMPYHFTYEGENVNEYYRQIDTINNLNLGTVATKKRIDSLFYSMENPLMNSIYKEDIQFITSEYMINNIDHAYSSWQNGLWAKHITFEDFCEYILPYRFGTENIEYWRERLEKKFKDKINWLDTYDQKRNSAYWAAFYLNQQIEKHGQYLPPFPIDHPVSYYEKMKIGDCRDYAIYTMFFMRACGVPVCIDYTPQWPNRGSRHIWNVLLNNNGKIVPFLGGDIDPGYPHYPADNFAKIFRQTYSFQKNSLFAIRGNELIPPCFDTPFIKDVSELYFEGIDVEIKLPSGMKISNRFAYLAVFNNKDWVPIQWGKINRGKTVNFKHMGRDIVYLPVLYENNSVKGISPPILINDTGKIIPLIADTLKKQTITLKRKYPKFTVILDYNKRVINTRIIASNRPDFKDSTVIGTIRRHPLLEYDTLNINTNREYRYWKYLSSDDSYCNIAELKLIQNGEDISRRAQVITNTMHSGECAIERAFDNDELTYYQSRWASGAWILLDFGKPEKIDYIRYTARNDDNSVKPGDIYELLYWDNNQWISLGKHLSYSDSLIHDNTPTNALFLLKNHTRGKEERIFTYKNGKQNWW